MVLVKNYETISKYVKVMPLFPDTVYRVGQKACLLLQ